MLSKVFRSTLSLNKSFSNYFSSAKKAGNLYTWGNNPGLGYAVAATTTKVTAPTLVDTFNNNVVKAVLGSSHSAVITSEGDLYTFGSGQNGALGHNDKEANHIKPKVVDFFKRNNLKVTDVAVGERHTIALTDDGDVWTWGYGGKSRNLFLELFAPSFGALGHGPKEDRHIPTPVESLRTLPVTVQVTAGNYFSNALNSEHDLYSWGRGEYAVFGDGSNKNAKVPTKNESVKRIRDTEGIVIRRIKSCASQTLALTEDGVLYGWGSNEHGQLGVRTEIGIEMYETANYPTKVSTEKLKGKKIIDFDIAENTAILLTDTNEVFWMGLKLAYEPVLLPLPAGKIVRKVAASHGSVCAITEDNQVYMKNKFLKDESENLETGVFLANTSIFQGGEIIEMGGAYKNKYAIIKN